MTSITTALFPVSIYATKDLYAANERKLFLRVLEYYTGILFLTTNRVGAFDMAFKSRIHISLYCPPLTARQTLDIWKMNLDALRERKKDSLSIARPKIIQFAKDHYTSMREKEMQWNGQQIRNAVQTAVALAEREYSVQKLKQQGHSDGSAKTDIKPCELLRGHFETVASAAEEFDNHLIDIYGAGEDERAFNRMDRAKKGEVANHFKGRGGYKYSTPREHDRRGNYAADDSPFFDAKNSRAHRNAAGRGHGWSRSQHHDDFGEEEDYNQQEEGEDAPPQFRNTRGGQVRSEFLLDEALGEDEGIDHH